MVIAAPSAAGSKVPAPATIAPVAFSSPRIWLLMSFAGCREVASPGVTPTGNQRLQVAAVVAERVVVPAFVRTGDVPVERNRHVENRRSHALLLG
jgi:hypothetical protein